MKILHISPYSPVPQIFGGALRVYHILEGLARRHEVTFLTVGTDDDRRSLAIDFGESVGNIQVIPSIRSPFLRRWRLMTGAVIGRRSLLLQSGVIYDVQEVIDKLFRKDKYDLVLAEFPAMAQFHMPDNVITIPDEHNIESRNLERMYHGARSPLRKLFYYREFRRLQHDEIEVCRRMNAIFVTSECDAKLLDKDIPDKPKYIIPNGVDTRYFAPCGEGVEPYSMVFTGTMDYFPNNDAMEYFVDSIFPLIKRKVPQAKLYIVGKNPAPGLKHRASKDIIVTGFVSDVRPYTRRAAAYVVSLRMGSGTRLKILEELAMKKAIVTTSIGCEGIDVQDGVHVQLADDPATFAEKVTDIFCDGTHAKALREKGYELVRAQYDWKVVEDQMETALRSIVERNSKASATGIKEIPELTGVDMSSTDRTFQTDSSHSIKVLMYHRVVRDSYRTPGYAWTVSQSQLRKQIEMLDKWGYTWISFQDYILCREGKLNLPMKPVVLTFDDGYDEVYQYAFPVLEEFKARATIFVLGDPSIRTNSWEDLSLWGTPLMDREKILELHRAGFEIGSHSLTHQDLSLLSLNDAWNEITKSKEDLEEFIGEEVIAFAYMFGSTTPDVEGLVRKAGYNFGCGTYSGPPKFEDDIYNIRRIPADTRDSSPTNGSQRCSMILSNH